MPAIALEDHLHAIGELRDHAIARVVLHVPVFDGRCIQHIDPRLGLGERVRAALTDAACVEIV